MRLPSQISLYQLAFRTPGISPFKLNRRKQIRHMRNRLKKPRTRPQSGHRWYACVGNLVLLAALFLNANRDTIHLLACASLIVTNICHRHQALKGIPRCFSKALPSSFVRAVVTMVMSIPWIDATLSYWISGKISCSFRPSV